MIIPHGGGAVPYHWGRYRGLAQDMKRPLADGSDPRQRVLRHVRLPPAGHRPADRGGTGRQHPVRVRDGGALRGLYSETGQDDDDTKRYVDAAAISDADKARHLRGQRPQGVSADQRAVEVTSGSGCSGLGLSAKGLEPYEADNRSQHPPRGGHHHRHARRARRGHGARGAGPDRA